jgi:hypothetical protein
MFDADKRIAEIDAQIRQIHEERARETHTFGVVDDCIRCLDCEVLELSPQSNTECPAHRERLPFYGDR